MKKIHLLLCAIVAILASCTPSPEEKAEQLVAESLKGTLYHPDSYEPISTTLDSAFINFENLAQFGVVCSELGEQIQQQEEYQRELRSAESSISIYAPDGYYYSEHSRVKYNQYKEECEEYQRKLEKLTPKIEASVAELRNLSDNLASEEFTGWFVTHRFTSKNGANTVTLPGHMIFICDKELTKCGSGMDAEDFEKFFELVGEIKNLETNEDVIDFFKEANFLL